MLLLAGACAPTVTTHGYQPDPAAVASIRVGGTSREEVQRLLGSPSSVGTFDGDSWFYVSQRQETRSFYQSQLVQQDVVRIDFDANGIVSNITRRDLAEAQNIEPDPNRTRTMGNELTVLQQFVGNIGRFNPSQDGPAPSIQGRSPGSTGF
jgi:outer membrane protein assembly factor BamE (lipoprotein component of BamABCDE complex)